VTEADLTDATLTGAGAGHVDWSTAKVPPAEIPESLPTPPPWLPVLLAGIIVVVVIVMLRRKASHRS
jgi:hypothetical protein